MPQSEGSYQGSVHIGTDRRKCLHLPCFFSLQRCVNVASRRFSASSKFHSYLCLRNAIDAAAAALSFLIFTPSFCSVVGWTGVNAAVHHHNLKTFLRDTKVPYFSHTVSYPANKPSKPKARLFWEEKWRAAAKHSRAVGKVAFLFTKLVSQKTTISANA